MDSIFEEDADEVGGEIEAYCPSPRCKADTTHTIISMYEDEVRRVQCVVCGEVHPYRKPRGDGVEGEGDGTGKKGSSKRLNWEEAMARATDTDLGNCRPYSIRQTRMRRATSEAPLRPSMLRTSGSWSSSSPTTVSPWLIFRDGGS